MDPRTHNRSTAQTQPSDSGWHGRVAPVVRAGGGIRYGEQTGEALEYVCRGIEVGGGALRAVAAADTRHRELSGKSNGDQGGNPLAIHFGLTPGGLCRTTVTRGGHSEHSGRQMQSQKGRQSPSAHCPLALQREADLVAQTSDRTVLDERSSITFMPGIAGGRRAAKCLGGRAGAAVDPAPGVRSLNESSIADGVPVATKRQP